MNYNNLRDPESFLDGFNLNLSSYYISRANTRTIIFGLLCVACFVLAVIFIKKCRGLGITAAIMQLVGLFAANRAVIAFAEVDYSRFYVVEYGYSYDDAYNKAMDKLMDAYIEAIPSMAMYYVWGMVAMAAGIISIIYVAKIMKSKGKALGVFALIFSIIKLIVPPVQVLSVFTEGLSRAAQESWDGVYRFLYILPAIFVAIQALVNIKKNEPAPVAPATNAAPVYATPVAPVAPAPAAPVAPAPAAPVAPAPAAPVAPAPAAPVAPAPAAPVAPAPAAPVAPAPAAPVAPAPAAPVADDTLSFELPPIEDEVVAQEEPASEE